MPLTSSNAGRIQESLYFILIRRGALPTHAWGCFLLFSFAPYSLDSVLPRNRANLSSLALYNRHFSSLLSMCGVAIEAC